MKNTTTSVTTVVLFVLFTIDTIINTASAQTFPAPSSCTSNDLSLVGVTLTGGNTCNTCTPGSTITRTVNFGINNKTGSIPRTY